MQLLLWVETKEGIGSNKKQSISGRGHCRNLFAVAQPDAIDGLIRIRRTHRESIS
jgi:hypothetical protein